MVRREDFRLITGHGRYTADWNLPNQLHAVFMRADRAHAEIARLDITRALAFPGVRAVLTGNDAREAGFKSLSNGVPFPGKDGQQIRKAHYPVLAQGRVRFVGEPVAMIVADTPTIGEDARELIEVDYRDLPAVSSFDAAVKTVRPSCTPTFRAIWRSNSSPATSKRLRPHSRAPATRARSPSRASGLSATRWNRAPAWWHSIPPTAPTRFTCHCRVSAACATRLRR
jgi:CO/xanthine dehydrogenase Mo-binding subunit